MASGGESAREQVRVIIWSFPRTLSTALIKCLSQIEESEIWFEPYCFCSMAASEYRRAHGRELPMSYRGNETKFAEAARLLSRLMLMPPDCLDPEKLAYESVKDRLENTTSKYVIVKDAAFSMSEEKYRRYIADGFTHAFLIREPVAAISSYRQATYQTLLSAGLLSEEAAKDEEKFDIERDDFVTNAGMFHQEVCELWRYTSQLHKKTETPLEINSEPSAKSVIIESGDLLTKPHEVLPKFCRAVGLPYNQSFLQWDASTDVAFRWKAAGKNVLQHNVHFYKTAMNSSCFMPPKKKGSDQKVCSDVQRLSEKAKPYYDEMCEHKL